MQIIMKYSEMQDSPNEFPNNIYKTGRMDINGIPDDIKESYDNIIRYNPEYSLFYFNDDDCKEFIKKNYDHTIYKCYLDLVPSAFRADYFRYLILYKHGGVYMDFSLTPLIPLSQIISDSKEIYVKDRWDAGIWNGFICSPRESKVIGKAIEKCTSNILNRRYTGLDLGVTGPYLLAESYRETRGLVELMDNSGKGEHYMMYVIDNNCEFILDPVDGKRVIKVRSESHHKSLYGSQGTSSKKYYHNLWREGKLYRDNIRIRRITSLYREILNRDPDESGLDHWHNTFLPISQIRDCMMNSEEKRNMSK